MDFFLFEDFAKRVKREVKFGGSPFYSLPCSPGFGSPYFLTFFFFLVTKILKDMIKQVF